MQSYSIPSTLRQLLASGTVGIALAATAQTPPTDATPAPPPATSAPKADATAPGTVKPIAPKTEKLEVTEKRTAVTDRRDSSASKIIISREDIEQYGDSNLGDVMRRLPGVTVGGRPGRGGPPAMRGMGGGFTQILIDGERMAPGFSIEQITPEQVERIEILRAPTAETGARAIAGTINIVLREPLRNRNNDIRLAIQDERGRLSPNLSYSRNDTMGPTGTYNLTISANKSDQLTDTRSQSTYTDIPTGRVTLAQASFNQSSDKRDGVFTSGRFQWRLGPGEQFSIQPFLISNKTTSRSEGTLTQTVGVLPAPYANFHSNGENKVNIFRLVSALNKRLDPSTRIEVRAGLGQLHTESNSRIRELLANGSQALLQTTDGDAKDKSWNTVGKLLYNWGNGKHNLVTGWELEGVNRTDNSTTLLNGVPQLADFGNEINVSTRRKALYIQDEWDPLPQLGTYFGLRWERIETKSRTASNPVNNKSSVITPLAQGVWRFDSPRRDQIRLALTQSYRSPTTQNLVARPNLNTLFPVPGPNTSIAADRAGNANLKPELANGVDLAYENYLSGGGVISVNLFSRHIRDLIRNVTRLETVSWATSPRFVTRPQNLGKATTSGIEFDAKFRLPELVTGAPAINFRTNFSIFDSTVDSVPGPNNRISDQPRATGNFGADYRFAGTPFSIGGSVNWVPAYNTQLTDTQLQKISTKRVLDAYALWTFSSSMKLRLSLSNLTPHDAINTNAQIQGNELQTVVTNGKTSLSGGLRLEIRL